MLTIKLFSFGDYQIIYSLSTNILVIQFSSNDFHLVIGYNTVHHIISKLFTFLSVERQTLYLRAVNTIW